VQSITIRVLFGKKCKALIAKGKNGIPTQPKVCVDSQDHKFWFCVDDIHRCVEGAVRTSILKHPSLPIAWLMMSCTNFIISEIVCLEEVGFCLPKHSFTPKDIFGSMPFEGGDDEHQ
jgi:hypothetical protein